MTEIQSSKNNKFLLNIVQFDKNMEINELKALKEQLQTGFYKELGID
jgi:hypothetical protein